MIVGSIQEQTALARQRPIAAEHLVAANARATALKARRGGTIRQGHEYLFGSANTTLPTPEEVQASVEAVQGVSGRVETLIVLPSF